MSSPYASRRAAIVAIPLLSACRADPPPVCVDLWQDDQANHVQPYELAIDPVARLAWSSGLASRSVAAIDLDTGAEVRTLPLDARPLVTPVVIVDGQGVLWIGSGGSPSLLRLDPVTGARTEIGAFGRVDALVPTATGIIALGRVDEVRTVVAFDSAGTAVATRTVEATGLVAHPDGAVLLAADGVVVSPTLEELDRCVLPFPGARDGAVLDDGRIAVADEHHVGWCDGDSWTIGSENKDVIAHGDTALVLDRLGPDDPNLGVARTLTATGVTDAFVTAKNTGFGAIDPVTGLLWANSEGTSEVVAWDPDSGDPVYQVRTGAMIDGLALDPDDPDVLFVTGRLSDSIARADGGVITAQSDAVRWPYSPVLDTPDDRLWVLSQTAGALVGLDPTSLAVAETIDLGAGPNPLLTFGSVTLDPDRGTVFVAESNADALFEVRPGGGVVARWDLGGPAITDPDAIGEVVVRLDSATGDLVVGRSNDGRLVRVTPDVGVVAVGAAPAGASQRMDLLRVFGDRRRAWLGGAAFRLDTLARDPDHDLPVASLVGPFEDRSGEWVALSEDGLRLVRVNDGGRIEGALPIAAEDIHATVLRLDAAGDRVLMGRGSQGTACWFDVADIR